LQVSGISQSSGPYTNITFNTGTYSGGSTTVCVQLAASSTRGVHGLTCQSNSTDAPSAVLLDSSNNSIEDVIIAGFYNGILVGENAAAQSDVLLNISGSTKGCPPPQCINSPINVINIAKSGNTVTNLSIMGASNSGGSGTSTIYDNITSTTLSDPYVAMYILGSAVGGGNNGYSRFTTSLNAATWVAGPNAPSNVPCSASAGGSLFSNTSGNGVALWFCPVAGGTWTKIR
jgi:hypothetical protein